MSPGPADLEFVSFVTTSAVSEEAGVTRTRYRHRTFFVGSDLRGLAASGQLDYVPISLEDVPELLASGKLQALCYKEDIESALRTPGMGGFELLDLHDFPGQGTALVGVLDPFWGDKLIAKVSENIVSALKNPGEALLKRPHIA